MRAVPRRSPIDVAGRVWAALAQASRPLSAPDLHDSTGAALCAVHKPLRAWAGAGLITIIEGRPKRFVMPHSTPRSVRSPTIHHDGRIAIRPRSARDRLWSAIRALKAFDMTELLLASSTTRGQAQLYLHALERAGYVQRQAGAYDCPRFRLCRQCGPRAPSITQRRIAGRWVREVVDNHSGARFRLSPDQPVDGPTPGDRGEG